MMRDKIYFASDFHLGAPSIKESKSRERKICNWLDSISNTAKEIYLVGDVFDFWFEYKHTIPKGFERLKSRLIILIEKGVNIHFFPGNHDLWTFGYLEKEMGLIVHKEPLITTIENKTFYISHGDGLGSKNMKYKFLKKIFTSSTAQYLFSILHPSVGISLAKAWSKKSRLKGGQIDANQLRNELLAFSKNILTNTDVNYFVFGHIHQPIEIELNPDSKYINLGDWINHFSYLEFHKSNLLLKYF
ncbi:MAG: UDP-2,3-diacylglucosamine hydrolase [Flavobacteriales bacterium]|nr:UDP-2,3-diacylglucosamine hydrolase [Flavobacteriales bacterium]